MTDFDYDDLMDYLKNRIDGPSCKVSVGNFGAIIRKITCSGEYDNFRKLIDTWVSTTIRKRPDLKPEVAQRAGLENIALFAVLADHGDGIKVATNPLSYYHENDFGVAMEYFVDYLSKKDLSMEIIEIYNN